MPNRTLQSFLLRDLPQLQVGVIGDCMLDRYIFGDVSRISPESPVPVNLVQRETEVLGGAANVANNLAQLDCQVHMASRIGDDAHGKIVRQLLEENGIQSTGVFTEDSIPTTTKTRILGGQQQMIRLDYEVNQPLSSDSETAILTWLDELLRKGLQGLVISDYGKGICQPSLLSQVFSKTRAAGIMTIVDPKGSDWSKYNGATCITPNVKELSEAVGYEVPNTDEEVVKAAHHILHKMELDFIIVTRSAKGITLVRKDGNVWHNAETKQQDVFDVSGAGDTVVAMMLTTLIAGLSIRAALVAANAAAGVVVSKVGTYPIHRQELLDLLSSMKAKKEDKESVYSVEALAKKIRLWQDRGEVVVFTNGCFDILHRGHLTYLKEAATLGDHLVVALNSDSSVRRLKGDSRPINHELDRALLMSSLGFVDGVVLFEEDTPAEVLSQLRPNILVKGGDYKPEEVIGKEFVEEVQILPFQDGYSTTGIIERIKGLVKEGKL